jgi:hypothetical protein
MSLLTHCFKAADIGDVENEKIIIVSTLVIFKKNLFKVIIACQDDNQINILLARDDKYPVNSVESWAVYLDLQWSVDTCRGA